MLTNPTIETLKSLKLQGLLEALEEQQRTPPVQALSFEERLALLVDRERLWRENQRRTRLLRGARLKVVAASVEDIDYKAARGLDKRQIATLATGEWIRRAQNLLITGATGSGKTWIACALAQQTCRQGRSVLYWRVPRLIEELRIAHGDGSYIRFLKTLSKASLIVLDDWGLAALSVQDRADLLEILDDRVNSGSTLIASQLPVEAWHAYLGEPTLADAILDRLVHQSHRIELKVPGESMRKLRAPVDA
ncbi:MAG: IS21-like element helper ATPase IstB [Steroidobacteraceae bacterium]|jgi:DNA replication protein DnaC